MANVTKTKKARTYGAPEPDKLNHYIMNIQIKKISINNFKGISALEVNFKPVTTLAGTNATGKSSVYDAFWWCLFGKDSSGSAQFTIKPQGPDGEPLPKLENEVEVILNASGRHITLKRVQREKWVTRRGEAEATFTGHETLYFVDEVGVSQKDYNAAVADIVSEDVFKAITSVTHFNSLKWTERRTILFNIVGEVSDQDVAATKKEFAELLDKLAGKDLERFKAEIRQKIKKAKEALEHIPARIDEVKRGIPEAVNVEAVKAAIEKAETEIEDINEQLSSSLKADEAAIQAAREIYAELSEAKAEIEAYKRQIRSDQKAEAEKKAEDLNRSKREYLNAQQRAEDIRQEISNLKTDIDEAQVEVNKKRTEWAELNAETFKVAKDATICPACKQNFPADKAQEIIEKASTEFNETKLRKLTQITQSGQRETKRLDLLKQRLNDLQKEQQQREYVAEQAQHAFTKMKEAAKPSPEMHPEFTPEQQSYINAVTLKVSKLEEKYQAAKAAIDKPEDEKTAALRSQRGELQSQLKELNSELQTEAVIKRAHFRISNLQTEQKTLSQQIAELQRTEFSIEAFTKAKVDMIEEKLNGMFSFVQFRMFDKQINEGVKETCVTLVNGVPYPDLNTASKVNAGLDIINVLSRHFGVVAPVFIDNRESVVSLIDTESQIINLVVDESKPILEVR